MRTSAFQHTLCVSDSRGPVRLGDCVGAARKCEVFIFLFAQKSGSYSPTSTAPPRSAPSFAASAEGSPSPANASRIDGRIAERIPAVPPEDRWTKRKMAEFLRMLGATQCVASAARAVGMSRQSAYKLRNRLKGEPFDIAWEAAFQHGYDALHQAALERALFGVEVPVFFNGEQIGTRRHFDERLAIYFLSRRNAAGAQRLSRYGAAAEFWSERWDELVDRVERGDARWIDKDGKTRWEGRDDEAAEEARFHHGLDEGESRARFGRFG